MYEGAAMTLLRVSLDLLISMGLLSHDRKPILGCTSLRQTVCKYLKRKIKKQVKKNAQNFGYFNRLKISWL